VVRGANPWASARGAVQTGDLAVLQARQFLLDRRDVADMDDHLVRSAASDASAGRASGRYCFVDFVDRCRAQDRDYRSAWADGPESPDVLLRLQGRRQQGALQKADFRWAARFLAEHPVWEQQA
jgi:hypothetical protein